MPSSKNDAANDPTSLGNVARMDGLTEAQVAAALAHQESNPVPLGQALVDLGYIGETTQIRLVNRQKSMRSGKPSRHDALDMTQWAIDKLGKFCARLGVGAGVKSPDDLPKK